MPIPSPRRWIAYLLAMALSASAAAGQSLPLLSPAPTDDEDPVSVSTAWSLQAAHPSANAVLAVVLDIRSGYHIMADKGQLIEVRDFKPFATRVWVSEATEGVLAEPPFYPRAQPFKVDFVDAPIMSFEGRAVIYLPVRLDLNASGGTLAMKVGIEYQACAPEYCLMPQRRILEAEWAPGSPDGNIAEVNRELFFDYENRAASGSRRFIPFSLFGFGFALDPAAPLTAALVLILAAFGGFLLNFTPCVLPLIPIKLISLSNAAAADRRRCLSLGLFTFAGVMAFWVALGGIVSMVSGFTSTHQLFQYPAFTIGVGLIIAAMALGMFGVYSVRLPGVVYALNPRQETLLGALCVGVLTAVLSTPCTAPFMGTAAAWAATQKPAVTIAAFSAIGAGMGLPSLLAAFPRLVRRVPKTGPGSQLLKQAMAILMLAAAAYFIGIGLDTLLSDPGDPAGRLHWWPVMMLCAAAGVWTGLRAITLSTGRRARAIWAALGAGAVAICLWGALSLTDTGPISWVSYSPERLAQAFKEHKTVVMIFTAEWCLNCKVLEQSVWVDRELVKLASDPRVLPLKVDLTGSNPEGRKKLQEAGSLTIPLLVVYRPDGQSVFRSDFYTANQVAEAIRTALAAAQPKAQGHAMPDN
jgi:thiol:disulfide interchange protein DsbD